MSRPRRLSELQAKLRRAVPPAVAMVLASSPLLQASEAERRLSKVWVADNGDGTYANPVLHADYSDPDVVRVGRDFYLVSSSFNCVPGLPILHSRDLVNWSLVSHVLREQPPHEFFERPRHGGGAWAPSIRYRNGEYFVYWADPDHGIYLAKAKQPNGPWSEPWLVKRAKGWIDPSPLWDDDGRAYLVSARAASRSGIKSVLVVNRMARDGTRLLDDGVVVFDGHGEHPTVEGPKFFKRQGFYYIAAPAGGVATGWQLVLRSSNVYGPYQAKVVLKQGNTAINGPHQGGFVDTPSGQSWFIHFQDRGVYGRVVHLQPVSWFDGWPLVGDRGEPVLYHAKPDACPRCPAVTPAESDEFDQNALGLGWQWHANPDPNWVLLGGKLGFLRLICTEPLEGARNLWEAPNLLLQKLPAPGFTATAKLAFHPADEGDRVGLIVMGTDYATIAVEKHAQSLSVAQSRCVAADQGAPEQLAGRVDVGGGELYLRLRVQPGGVVEFFYGLDGANFAPLGLPFVAKPGRWIGAKVGLFAVNRSRKGEAGYADVDWFRIE